MIFRYEHILLAAAFVFGWVASAAGQTADPTNAVAASNFQMAEFDRFVPRKAELLIVHRPRQLSQHESLGSLTSSPNVVSPWFPLPDSEIDLVVAASTQETLDKIMRSQAEAVFEDISDQLSAIGDPPVSKNTRPSIANFLNADFSGLIQFREPIDWKILAHWLDEKNSATGKYQRRTWRGHETLDCGSEKCCLVLQLDERTYVFGNRQQLARTMDAQLVANPKFSDWLIQLQMEEFKGELFVGADMQNLANDWRQHVPNEGPWAMANEIKSARFQVDLNGSPLVKCQVELTQPAIATKFKTQIQTMFRDDLIRLDQQLALASDNSIRDKQAVQMLTIARKINFTQEEEFVQVELPRPAGFDQMLKQAFSELTGYNQQVQQDQQAAFHAIAADLESVEPPKTVDVLVFKRALKGGVAIKANDLSTETWLASTVSDDAMVVKQVVVGNLTRRDVHRGEPVLAKHLKAPAN